MNEDNLKPCPRCKNTFLEYIRWGATMSYAEVMCDNCDFSVQAYEEKTADKEVTEIWNSIKDWKQFQIAEYLDSYNNYLDFAKKSLNKAMELGYKKDI